MAPGPRTSDTDLELLIDRLAERAIDLLTQPDRDRPLLDFADPGPLTDRFADTVPLTIPSFQEPAAPDALVEAIDTVITGSVCTNHPRFVNQNFAGADPVAVVGDWLGAALNTTGATYEMAPVFTLMERALLQRLAELAGLGRPGSDHPAGIFCPGGSIAAIHGLQLARHRRWPASIRTGETDDRPVILVSSAGHYSARKAAAVMGLGTEAVIEVATDRAGAMRPVALAAAVSRAIAEGRSPFVVVATAGTTVTAAFDPLEAVADICRRHDLWLHVDGCYGASALFSPRQRHRLAGVERADSLVWDLHKMMGMTQQCTALLVAEPDRLDACFADGADYLFQPDKANADMDAGDRTFVCGRRIDALKLWLTWKFRGDDGMAARVDHGVAMADHARSVIADRAELSTVVAGDFTNVCFTWLPPELRGADVAGDGLPAHDRDRLHRLAPAVKARMQAEGTAMIGYQPVDGLNVFRLIFMSPGVTAEDVDELIDLVVDYSEASWPTIG